MEKIIILTDYKDSFWVSLGSNKKYGTMDVPKIKKTFENNGYIVEVQKFSDIDFNKDYTGTFVLYQSSESNGQFYKKYIEDIIYFFMLRGAIVLPKYEYLKAHHNKGFMEILRTTFLNEELKTLDFHYLGRPEEARQKFSGEHSVIKQNSGFGSKGVYLAKNKKEFNKYVYAVSSTIFSDSLVDYMKFHTKVGIKTLLSYFTNKYTKPKDYKLFRPFVIQQFIPELKGDYKVLYYGGKYYTLYRENRKNDFRASGSGKLLEVTSTENIGLLNFARKVIDEIDFPIIGMDIAFDGSQYHLIEFQMIHLGPYTLQKSKCYFEFTDNNWNCIQKTSDLEEEFTRSILEYIEEKSNILV